jgi:hypothetical protein
MDGLPLYKVSSDEEEEYDEYSPVLNGKGSSISKNITNDHGFDF